MPCMGPDCDYARKLGREVGEQVFAKLVAEHKLWDVADPKFDGFPWIGRKRENWAKAKEAFLVAVEEIFVDDACNSF